ncbi:hypothetical protein LDENG_00038570 [Lucifuga dentata]|nr:hypothetical protein LDENG_00038570 [Lucifuga dentata]
MIFKEKEISWEANVFMNQYECSNRGIRCESFPVARLISQNSLSQFQRSVVFNNLLLVMCKDKHICQVQDFKKFEEMAPISSNGTQVMSYPCPDNQYSYQFVVRPKYI